MHRMTRGIDVIIEDLIELRLSLPSTWRMSVQYTSD